MKKLVAILLVLTLCLTLASVSLADTVTLRTVSTFGGTDPSAQAYADLLSAWEKDTGNKVEDASAPSDEAWKASVLNDFAAGNEPDVIFYFAATPDSQPILDKVVSIDEINAAYPDMKFPAAESIREADGKVYAIPVRSFWEGLFVNTDIFDKYGLEYPTDKDKFETAVAKLKENGVVPMAISLSDIPHYIADFVILSSGSVADYRAKPKTAADLPASWIAGEELINHLYTIGAFPENVNSTTEQLTTPMFINKQAAMLLDGSWRANGILKENWDTTIVVPFPAYSDAADKTAVLGGTSMGFYITKKAWDDPAKRDAAVSLLAKLTNADAQAALGFTFGGELLKSAKALVDNANANNSLVTPIGDIIGKEAQNYWYSQIPGIADGTVNAKDAMTEVIARSDFAKQ